jgi:hypothetical protein
MTVGGIIGCIDVNHDHISTAKVGLRIEGEQPISQTPEVPPTHPILRATKHGLRRKIDRCLRKPSQGSLQSRISAKCRRIVRVLIAHGNVGDPLPRQGPKVVNDSTRIPKVIQRLGHNLGEPMTPIKLSEKQRTSVRRDPAAFKIRNDFFPKKRLPKWSCLWQTVFIGHAR